MTPPFDAAARPLLAGKYRLASKLGEGAMGVVYRGTHEALRRDVAIKVLHARFAGKPDFRLRFEREARVAAALDHPGAVEVFDFGEQDGHLYLVMELLEGEPLRARVDFELPLLPLSEALGIARAIGDVLAAAHRIQLVHRDIKPENVFLARTGTAPYRVVVVDFGLAFIADAEAGDVGRLTDAGVLGGTPGYLSPEQAQGKPLGPAADVYALGCLLFELLTGGVPFVGPIAEVLTRHVYSPPPALMERNPALDAPVALIDLVTRMLDKSAATRPSAAQVVTTLDDLAGRGPGARERGHDAAMLGSRTERALATPRVMAAAPEPAAAGPECPVVAVLGPGVAELELGLRANGLAPICVGDDALPATTEAAVTLDLIPERIVALAARGIPVIATADPADLAGITAAVRAGAFDLAPAPALADDLARRLWRAVRRARRRAEVKAPP
jgi:hypothetical protein